MKPKRTRLRAEERREKILEAARRVFKTQSAVSMQIKRLEERLGQPLFLRDGRRISLKDPMNYVTTFAYDVINRRLRTIGPINDTHVETIGWPELVDDVAAVVATLPATEQRDVVLLTGSYGEAGAIDRHGPAAGLPRAYSGHNSYWHWRRPAADEATVVAVRMSGDTLLRHFEDCHQAATIDNGLGIDNEAQGQPIWICRGLQGNWAERWPRFRHYS